MGCDIHAAMEYRNGSGKWEAYLTPDPYYGKYDWHKEPMTADLDIDRNYDVFAILGNVRNGRGFAGVKTGLRFNFISDNRGIPEDISERAREALSNEHSATWVGLAELLNFDWSQVTIKSGVVDAVEFEKWDRCKDFNPWPDSWCGGVSGPGIVMVSNQEMRKFVSVFKGVNAFANVDKIREAIGHGSDYRPHTEIEWQVSYMDCAKEFWVKVMPYALNLGAKYGHENVRLVMDFDS